MTVSITSPIPNDAMQEFFADIDVLLFPSLWDESFGLTVREAVASNIFVLTSDCGGPSECITSYENGIVFPKDDKEAFIKALEYVFERKNEMFRYTSRNLGDIRSFDAQVRDLLGVYKRIFAGSSMPRERGEALF